MARPTKLNPDTAQTIIDHIAGCATYKAAAEAAGISYDTFNNWMRRGREDRAWCDAHPNACVLMEELAFVQFFDAVTRAQARALTGASRSVHEGFMGAVAREFVREVITEPVRDKAGNLVLEANNEPKMFTRTIEREVVKQKEPDWRAGIEFLKRRDPENWSDKLIIEAMIKHVPAPALQLLPELAQKAEAAGLDLERVFSEMIVQMAQSQGQAQ